MYRFIPERSLVKYFSINQILSSHDVHNAIRVEVLWEHISKPHPL